MVEPIDVVVSEWRSVLQRSDVQSDSNFFSLGGTSLLATQLAARLSQEFNFHVPMRAIFQRATPAMLAEWLSSPPPTEHRSVVESNQRPVGAEDSAAPLSEQQRAIWFQERLSPSIRAYNCVTVIRIPQGIDESRLESALKALIDRHEALRTIFPAGPAGLPVQDVRAKDEGVLCFTVHRGLDEGTMDLQISEAGQTKFDPSQLPLIRWVLYKDVVSGGDVFVQVEHHFVHDGWSTWLMLTQISSHYRGDRTIQAPGASYREYALQQEDWMKSSEAASQVAYWVERLGGSRDIVRFSRDEQRPKVFNHRGASVIKQLAPAVNKSLIETAASLGATPFALLFSVFGMLISARTQANDFAIGVSYRNRDRKFENTVGMFVNVVGIPFVDWRERSFRSLVVAVSDSLAAGDERQGVPLGAVVRQARPDPQVTRNPILQVCLSLNDWPDQTIDFGDGIISDVDYPGTGAKFDLDVVALPPQKGSGWRLLWRYYAEVLDAGQVREMMDDFEKTLIVCATDPDVLLARSATSLLY